jgi:hypothetical protein
METTTDAQQEIPVPGIQTDRERIASLDEALKEHKELESAVERAKKKFTDHKGHVAMLLIENNRKKYVDAQGRSFEFENGEPKVKYRDSQDNGARRTRAPKTRDQALAVLTGKKPKGKTTKVRPLKPPKLTARPRAAKKRGRR